MHPLKLYLIAGEASGDMHASNMMREMLKEDASVQFRFWGGDKMSEVQKDGLVKHIRDLAFMGFWELILFHFAFSMYTVGIRTQGW